MDPRVRYMKEISSCKAYEKMLSAWMPNGGISIVYPDYYSGCYVNEVGNLVGLTTSSEQEEFRHRLTALTGIESIIVGYGGNLDAAFVEVNGQYEGSLTLKGGITLSTQIGIPATGSSVIFDGAVSSGSGTVVTTYGSCYDENGILFTNMLFIDCGGTLPHHGDSGCICYTWYDLPVGCMKGTLVNTTRAVICQAMYINSAFDLTMY